MRKRISILFLILLIIPACSGGNRNANTDPNSPPDNLRTIAVQCDRAAEGLNAAVDVKRALLTENLITGEQSGAMSHALLTITRSVRELKEGAEKYNDFSAGRIELSSLFAQLQNSFNDLTGPNGITTALSETARQRINQVLAIVRVAIETMRPLFA